MTKNQGGEDTVKAFGDFMKIDSEPKIESCESHGAYESKNIFKNVWSKCPHCASEQKAIQLKEQEEKDAQERHRVWQMKLGEACIPDRFKIRTLDAYDAVNEGQKRALSFARDYAENFEDVLKTGRSAIFCGMPGTGKTHLSIGIAIEFMRHGKYPLFTTVQRIMRRMKSTFHKDADETERDVMRLYVEPDLLIVDEIGVQFGSDFEKNLMFDILNTRYERRLPTLLLSNLTAKEVKTFLGDRVYDRLREDNGQCVSFDWQSHRGTQRNA